MGTKVQIGVGIEISHVRFLEYLANQERVGYSVPSRQDIIRRAVRSYINSKANDIELDKEIEKVEELGKKWEKASQSLWKKCEAERNLAELEDKRREAQIWKSVNPD